MNDIEVYAGREQAYVKHHLLRRYLQKLFYKICSRQRSIAYVDAFAGPWKSTTASLSDTSPHIAVNEWKAALIGLGKRGVPRADVKCLFIEEGLARSKRLRASFADEKDISIEVRRGQFARSADGIIEFAAGRFTFFFIDPTGWADIPLKTLAPILAHEPGEVLINLMTGHIARFADDRREAICDSIDALFPRRTWRSYLASVDGVPTEEAIAQVYCQGLKEVSTFRYVLWTPVLDPVANRIKYHLIYATRHKEGLRAFRDSERLTYLHHVGARVFASEQKAIRRDNQLSFGLQIAGQTDPLLEAIRIHYEQQARQAAREMLLSTRVVPFDDIEATALSLPFVWLRDVKCWIREWEANGEIEVVGLKPSERVPQPGHGHSLRWLDVA